MAFKEELENLIDLNEACEILGISLNTGRNWLRLHKLTPINDKGQFNRDTIELLAINLKSNISPLSKVLKGREFYINYIDKLSPNREFLELLIANFNGNKNTLLALLAESAITLMISKGVIKTSLKSHFLEAFILGKLDLKDYAYLIEELISNCKREFLLKHAQSLPPLRLVYEPYEDALGLIYLSLKELPEKNCGSRYYTPQSLTDTTIETLGISRGRVFLDISCGSGNFLLRLLKRGCRSEDLYGCDLDFISVSLSKINFALNQNICNKEFLKDHIIHGDALLSASLPKAMVIVGNPPWGKCEDEALVRRYAKNLNTATKPRQSYADFFVERALQLLDNGGIVQFVLPESLLNVISHQEVREVISQNARVKSIRYLGVVFHALQTKGVILTLEKTSYPNATGEVIVNRDPYNYIVRRQRDSHDFNFKVNDQEYKLLEKLDNLPHCIKLRSHADFALGIVTGANRNLLFKTRKEHCERVLRGADIDSFTLKKGSDFIRFEKEKFQQIAPLEYYRAPIKLVYRFIARYPIVAIDTHGYLTLNSCNVLVPRFNTISPYYLCAILNSKVVRFYFEKKFDTLKVLKSQLEQVPLPEVSADTQLEIEFMVKDLIDTQDKSKILKALNRKIADLYNLGKREYKLVGV